MGAVRDDVSVVGDVVPVANFAVGCVGQGTLCNPRGTVPFSDLDGGSRSARPAPMSWLAENHS